MFGGEADADQESCDASDEGRSTKGQMSGKAKKGISVCAGMLQRHCCGVCYIHVSMYVLG